MLSITMTTFKQLDLNRVPDECSSFEDPCPIPVASLGIIRRFKKRLRNFNGEKTNSPNYKKACTNEGARNASTIDIIKLAIRMFKEPCSKKFDGFPFVFGLSSEEAKDAELVHVLLVAAEEVEQQQFERANQLIKQCDVESFKMGTSVQRLVYYFANALQEKISKEAGGSTGTCNNGSQTWKMFDMKEALLSPNPSTIAYYLKSPCPQVSKLTGVQVVTEHTKGARKVHVIDFEFMSGLKFILLMQDLATGSYSSLEHLKITAVSTGLGSHIENTGKRLAGFAESLNLSFTFNIVIVEDLLDLSIDDFELEDNEEVVVYWPFVFSKLISQPARLETLMRMIRKINPCVNVIFEVESNHTSPVLIDRLMEALVYLGAIFDSMADCIGNDEQNRVAMESLFFNLRIHNVVVDKGMKRTVRHQGIHMWREIFAGFGMVEIELSSAAQVQANMLVRTLEHGSSCTIDMDGKCLIVGWKGVPVDSVSAWKFQ